MDRAELERRLCCLVRLHNGKVHMDILMQSYQKQYGVQLKYSSFGIKKLKTLLKNPLSPLEYRLEGRSRYLVIRSEPEASDPKQVEQGGRKSAAHEDTKGVSCGNAEEDAMSEWVKTWNELWETPFKGTGPWGPLYRPLEKPLPYMGASPERISPAEPELDGTQDRDAEGNSPKRAKLLQGEPAPLPHVVPVMVFWDIENCPVPAGVRPDSVAGNIRAALQRHHKGSRVNVRYMAAYGDSRTLSNRVREGLHRTGVTLVDVPNGLKNATDITLLTDMLLLADDKQQCSILLISNDVDFAMCLHKMKLRGHEILLAAKESQQLSPYLKSAASKTWVWDGILSRTL